jgi:hypothetical protein
MNREKITDYQIDNIIFQKGYEKKLGPFSCTGSCCSSGVFADVLEKEKILSFKEKIINEMDETQTKDFDEWFESEILEDPDFNSGKCVGTQIYNDKCVFLRKDKLCVLQTLSVKLGYHKWFLKPFYCILFPLVTTEDTVTFDDYREGVEECCTPIMDYDVPLFEACKEEICYLFGEDGYKYLQKYYSENKVDLLNSSLENKEIKN